MTKSKIFLYSCLFFILGIFIGSVFQIDAYYYGVILLVSIVFFSLGLKNKVFLVFGLFGLILVLGIWRYQVSLPLTRADKIYFYNGQKVEFQGLVFQEPDVRQSSVKLKIKVDSVLQNGGWEKLSGDVLVTTYLYPEYEYGDYLNVQCELQKPENINGFDYDNYLSRYGIYSICYYPKLELLGQNRGNFFLAEIYDFKSFFVKRLNKILSEPQSSFLAGLLIGAKKSIPADLQTAFSKTGTTHIVAVSGFNITIIVAFIAMILSTLAVPRKKSFWLVNAGLILFVVITGFQASILRAAIMGFLVLLGSFLGRLSRVTNALVLAAALMLVINPKLLVFDLGFQLSFLATLGLIYLQPLLSSLSKVENINNKFLKTVLGDYLMTTLAAIIMTTPIILYNFGKVSLVAPLANILVLPFIPLAMLLGFIAGLGGLISVALGSVMAWPVWLVLTYVIWILEKLSNLNWAYFEFSKINFWLMASLYLALVVFIRVVKPIKPQKNN
ncbi:MAG: ComEC/Rec2 family competence protein [Patescibacteria group bacterium]|nr:ComEC/Rec2 family competence protein [Patescibacteria group bacterium]